MTKLQKQRVRKWIAALRSGKFKRYEGALMGLVSNERCCLGVACDVYLSSKEGNGKHSAWSDNTFIADGINYSGYLPPIVKDWFGLSDTNPVVNTKNHGRVCLAHLNDVKGYSFSKIADLIEHQLLKDS